VRESEKDREEERRREERRYREEKRYTGEVECCVLEARLLPEPAAALPEGPAAALPEGRQRPYKKTKATHVYYEREGPDLNNTRKQQNNTHNTRKPKDKTHRRPQKLAVTFPLPLCLVGAQQRKKGEDAVGFRTCVCMLKKQREVRERESVCV
jgi:hypothetical protein